MPSAFQWKVPDTYWQRRCNKDLIFEFDDLIMSKKKGVIDWQFLCLGIEELLVNYDWYYSSGLRNRGRTLQLLQRIKGIFLSMLEQ